MSNGSRIGFKYAGIGSRKTPPYVCDLMRELAIRLAKRGATCRSGGADNADTAFEHGALLVDPALFELYLPWPGYNDRQAARRDRPTWGAYDIAERFHPFWANLRPGARHLHARNSHIVLGPDLDDPVGVVLCWTSDGCLDGTGRHCGGTGQALRVAAAYEIPVLNLSRVEHVSEALALVA